MSRDRCPHCFLVEECRPCSEGNPPYDRAASDSQGNACVRGCSTFRRHLKECPAEDRSQGAWLPFTLHGMTSEDTRQAFFDADTHALAPRWRDGIFVGQYGGLEAWWPCRGCLPREATHGSLCEPCHIRLSTWFAGEKHEGRWVPAEASIAWAFDWLAADREPRQNAAGLDKIMQGKKTPPAALNLAIHDLRQELAQALGQWLGMVCGRFDLQGPSWWRRRLTEARRRSEDPSEMDWRAWLPQTQLEVTLAQAYLHGWLERVEDVPDLAVSIYDTAENLLVRVASVAPWRAKPRRLPGIPCPECEAPALAIFEGEDHVTCMRAGCGALIDRKRYDIWTQVLMYENERRRAP